MQYSNVEIAPKHIKSKSWLFFIHDFDWKAENQSVSKASG